MTAHDPAATRPDAGGTWPAARLVVRLEGERRRALEVGRTRLLVTGALFALAFLALAARLVEVGLLSQGAEPRQALAPLAPPASERAAILDRNGMVLAANLVTASLYANPRQVVDPADAARRLAKALPDLSEPEITAKLAAARGFVWLKRNLTPRQQDDVLRIGIPGLHLRSDERRVYPQGALTAHVVGYTDIDNHGIAGIEQSFDDVLGDGYAPLALSLDVRVQHMLREELARAMAEFGGVGAAGMVLDANTGEVLALVSLPDFDPGHPAGAAENARFNRASLGVYEMGSPFKAFNTAAALDLGIVDLDDRYDATRPISVNGYTISDYEPENRWLSVREIFARSSNIGAAKMALDVGAPAQQDFLRRLGMFRASSIELPELGLPSFPAAWRPINTMTIGFGHGIAVTPVHLAAGIAAMVNGGIMRPATLIRRAPGEIPDGERVISEATSAAMRQLMRLAVEAGTGKRADAPGYLVGGKTGTAQKTNGHGYSAELRIASFVGAFPMSAPRYVVLAMIDEPKPNATSRGQATGGWVAAPAVGRLVQRMAPLLGIEPIEDALPDAANPLLVAVSAQE